MLNAMMIDGKDNVAVAIEPITKGETVTYLCDGEEKQLTARADITIYHKLAVRKSRLSSTASTSALPCVTLKSVTMSMYTTWKAIVRTWKRRNKEDGHDFLWI